MRHIFLDFLTASGSADSAHDIDHIERVVATATQLGREEGAEMDILLPAAWLHDCVAVAKDHPQRKQASLLAADRAVQFLQNIDYPPQHLAAIHHAIVAHSFSANVILSGASLERPGLNRLALRDRICRRKDPGHMGPHLQPAPIRR